MIIEKYINQRIKSVYTGTYTKLKQCELSWDTSTAENVAGEIII